MKMLKIAWAVVGSASFVSISAAFSGVLPIGYSFAMFGIGAGSLLAAAAPSRLRSKSQAMGEVDALPGIPTQTQAQEKPRQEKTRSLDRQKVMNKYDRAFAHLLSRTSEQTKAESLERLRLILYELSPELKAWTGDARLRAHLLMQEIVKGLDDPSTARASMGLLVLILSQGGRSASEMARPVFREKILEMYGRPAYESERFLPRILLMLDDYDPQMVEKLAKEAIHEWGDDRFSAARDFLGFEELKEMGPVRQQVKVLLGTEIAKAGDALDRAALERAVELYHEVK